MKDNELGVRRLYIYSQDYEGLVKDFDKALNTIKAFNIIRDKQVDVYGFFRSKSLEYYNETIAKLKVYYLTEEEYELLNEALGELYPYEAEATK